MKTFPIITKNILGDSVAHQINYMDIYNCCNFYDFRTIILRCLENKTINCYPGRKNYLNIYVNNNEIYGNELKFKKYFSKYKYMEIRMDGKEIISDDIANIIIVTEHKIFYLEKHIISYNGLDLSTTLNELGYNLIGDIKRMSNKEIPKQLKIDYPKYKYCFKADVTPRFCTTKSARNV